jgi:hypothetical protein
MRRGGLRQSSVATLMACVVACVLLAQLLAFAVQRHGTAGFLSRNDNSVIATPDSICSDRADDGRVPLNPTHNHLNCVFCAAGDRDPVSGLISTALKTIIARPLQSGAACRPLGGSLIQPLMGWLSSWSSQAPPSFS